MRWLVLEGSGPAAEPALRRGGEDCRMRTVKYKGRQVRLMCAQSESGWVVEALVVGKLGNGVGEHQILDPLAKPLPTLADAEERAITLAMEWIDDNLP